MLLYVVGEEQQYDLGCLLSPAIPQINGGLCVLWHSCGPEQSSGLKAAAEICLALIMDSLRRDCAPNGACDAKLLTNELQHLAAHSIDLGILRQALVSQSVLAKELFKQPSAMARISAEYDYIPIIAIEELGKLDRKGLAHLNKLLHDTMEDTCCVFLVAKRNAFLCEVFENVPQIDKDTERQGKLVINCQLYDAITS